MKNMNTKKILVSFLTVVSVLFLVATASAADISGELANKSTVTIKVDDASVFEDEVQTNEVAVTAGDTISVKVVFTSEQNASNVRIRAELEGETNDVTEITKTFDVEENKTYVEYLTLKVPSDFEKDERSNDLTLNIKIWNSDYKTEVEDILLNMQRPSYDLAIKSVIADSIIEAGKTFPINVVLKNVGYNDADDVYVTVSISELGIQKSTYFGDIVTGYTESQNGDNDEDTVSGRLYLGIPADAEEGAYELQVKALNDETSTSFTGNIYVENEFPEPVIKSDKGLLFLNPTSSLKAYKVVFPEGEEIVTVQTGSSKSLEINPTSEEYTVSVLTMNGEVVNTFTFSATEQPLGNSVVVITVALAIVFVVLLIVLIVLITKKPQKTEEFGESYY